MLRGVCRIGVDVNFWASTSVRFSLLLLVFPGVAGQWAVRPECIGPYEHPSIRPVGECKEG